MMDSFEWDENKNEGNQEKHGIPFEDAQLAFLDPKRIIALDKAIAQPRRSVFTALAK